MVRRRQPSTVEQLVEQFARWLPGEADPEELGNLDLILTVRRDVVAADLLSWRTGDVAELLLEVFPRRVQSDESLLRDGPRVLGQFFDFLAQEHRLRGAPLHRLQGELAEVAPRFVRAMRNGSQFGMAESLVSSMAADGVAFDDPAAVQKWIADYNARSFEERVALTDGVVPAADVPADPPPVLPAVTLAPQVELLQAAVAAPLVQRVRALMAHVGAKGLAVTTTGALRLVDAKALAAACGDEERLHRPAHWQRDVRRMADLPGVAEAYELAHLAGLLDLSATRVRLADDAPQARDDLVLVAALADAALELGVFVAAPHAAYRELVDAVSDEVLSVLAALYVTAEPLGVEDLAGDVAEDLGLHPGGGPGSAASTVRSYLERVFERFERLGVVQRLGVRVPPERALLGLLGERATSVALTPLGVWWLQQALSRSGLRAPVRGELVGSTAEELCDGVAALSLEDGQDEVRAWSAARDREAAAREMASLLADAQAVRRQFALHVLGELPDAEDGVRPLLNDATARPYARLWLESRGLDVADRYRRPEDEPLLFVDTASLLVDLGAVDELVAQLDTLGEPQRQVDLVRQLWRVDSPSTERVLTALADAAPAPVSKAARKALHSLRSAGR